MSAIVVCTVSGTVLSPANQGLSGVTVKANMIRPFVGSNGTSVFLNSEVSTTTDTNGAWSLDLVENTTSSSYYTISFEFPSGSAQYARKDYSVLVPSQTSVQFATLITGQT